MIEKWSSPSFYLFSLVLFFAVLPRCPKTFQFSSSLLPENSFGFSTYQLLFFFYLCSFLLLIIVRVLSFLFLYFSLSSFFFLLTISLSFSKFFFHSPFLSSFVNHTLFFVFPQYLYITLFFFPNTVSHTISFFTSITSALHLFFVPFFSFFCQQSLLLCPSPSYFPIVH